MPTGCSESHQDIKVGDIVERDIDGILFPAKVLGIGEKGFKGQGSRDNRSPTTFYLKYLDDNNCEGEVPEDEIQRVYDERKREDMVRLSVTKTEGGASGGEDGGTRRNLSTGKMAKDETTDNEWGGRESNRATVAGPKVTIHSSHGTFDAEEDGSATAYIINGPETNVAAGSGLSGIRWLRG